MQEQKSLHYILGASLAVIAVFVVVALVMINSQASDTQVTINNVAPSVADVYLADSAYEQAFFYSGTGFGVINDLSAGSTITRYVTGTVEDLNGNGDIATVTATLYRSGVTDGHSCTADKNSCYRVTSCELQTNGNDDQKDFSCEMALNYFMDSTDVGGRYSAQNWVIYVTVSDGTANGSDEAKTGEVSTLLALSIPGSIGYGTLALGATTTSSTNQIMTITQTGNDEADVEVSSSTAMGCTVRGLIPVASQQWSLTDVDYSAEGTTALSGSAADTALNVGYQDDEATAPTKSLYWNISIPSSGVEGVCTGADTVTAIAH